MDTADLRRTMNQLAWDTWLEYEDGSRYGLEPGEESITDRNLLELRRRHPGLHVHKYTHVKERKVGADWEWWIGSDAEGWICLRIQAKRIHSKHYAMLEHPGAEEGEFQYQTLIGGCAEAAHIFPFHVFYNGWEPTRFATGPVPEDVAAWEFNEWWLEHRKLKQQWGCAALSSYQVARLHWPGGREGSYVPRYLEHSMPWSELFSVTRDTEAFRGMSPAAPLDLIHHRLIVLTRRAAENSREAWIPGMSSAERRSELPSYAEMARESSAERRFGSPEEIVDIGVESPVSYVVIADLGENGRGAS